MGSEGRTVEDLLIEADGELLFCRPLCAGARGPEVEELVALPAELFAADSPCRLVPEDIHLWKMIEKRGQEGAAMS